MPAIGVSCTAAKNFGGFVALHDNPGCNHRVSFGILWSRSIVCVRGKPMNNNDRATWLAPKLHSVELNDTANKGGFPEGVTIGGVTPTS